ncbi:MAG TPA: SbtA family thio(seleno)oxazole RiPP natural product precursor [Dissulfurispiraceae bacterium]|nr:SbtA family thio(seleno)oxazole RiPP natural product precursor [Dissulfurispiraceae bacterium]
MDSKILRNVLAGLSIAGLLTGVATPGNSASG